MPTKFLELSKEFALKGSVLDKKFLLYNYKQDLSFDIDKFTYEFLFNVLTKKQPNTFSQRQKKLLNFFLNKSILLYSNNPSEYKPKKAYGGRFIRRIHWHLTDRCNLKCVHCYINVGKSKDINLQEAKKIIDQMEELNVLYVSLTGGEPFLREDIGEIINYLNKKRIGIKNINTNGTIISQRILNILKNLYPKVRFFISLDGPEPKSHNLFRGVTGFKKTINGIKRTQKNGFKVLINTSLHIRNINQIGKMYKLIKNLNIAKWRISRPFSMGRWLENRKTFNISLEEEVNAYKNILKWWEKDNFPFELELGSAFRIQFEPFIMKKYLPSSRLCGYYYDSCSILPNGDVIPCGALVSQEFHFGNAINGGIHKAWMSKKMRNFKNTKICNLLKIKENKKCKKCKYLVDCGMGCRVSALNFQKNVKMYDPVLCGFFIKYGDDKIFKNAYKKYTKKYETSEF